MTLLRPLVSLFVFALAVLWSGSALADVRCVQEVLSKTVFDPGPVDGLWGKNTANAARDFLIYRDGELSVEVAKSNSDALCQTVSDEGRDYEPLTLRRYAIIIAPEKMESHRFDFANLNVDQNLNKDNCTFEINRIDRWGLKEIMGSGILSINQGLIQFREHSWSSNLTYNNKKYLHDDTSLAISSDGKLMGTITTLYYYQDGRFDRSPLVVKLDENSPTFIRRGRSSTKFSINHGMFEAQFIFWCE